MKKRLLQLLLIFSLLLGAIAPIPVSYIPFRSSRSEETGVFSSLEIARPPADIRVKLYWMSIQGTELHDVQHAQPFQYTEDSIKDHSNRFLQPLFSDTVSDEFFYPRKCLLVIDNYGYFPVWDISFTFSMHSHTIYGSLLFDDETGGILKMDLHTDGSLTAFTILYNDGQSVYYHENWFPTAETIKNALIASWHLEDIQIEPYMYQENYYHIIIPRGEYRPIKVHLYISPGHIDLGL